MVLTALLGMGCEPKPSFQATDAKAIELARRVPGVSRIEAYPGRFGWQVIMWCKKSGPPCPLPRENERPELFPIRIACYCDKDSDRPRGWFVVTNLATNSAEAISGNRKLQKRYDLP